MLYITSNSKALKLSCLEFPFLTVWLYVQNIHLIISQKIRLAKSYRARSKLKLTAVDFADYVIFPQPKTTFTPNVCLYSWCARF